MRGRIISRMASVAFLAGLFGCTNFDEGPPLRVDVAPGFALQPTAVESDLCCCTVVGTATNLSSVNVHATIRFSAHPLNPDEGEGTAIDFLADMAPNVPTPIRAAGLLVPCDHFDTVTLVDVDMRGVAFP